MSSAAPITTPSREANTITTHTLLIVIVNYKTPEVTIDCLRSLATEIPTVATTHVVVADNASGDESLARIQAAIDENRWTAWCSLVPLPKNGGFSYGNNRGYEAGPPADYVLLLNSDTIVHPGCLRTCIDTMERESDVGAMTCKLLNADGTVQVCTRRFPTPLRLIVRGLGLPWYLPSLFEWADTEDLHWDRAPTSRDVDWIIGAFILTRGEIVKKLGLLDEAFFFYGEDIEFSHRLSKHGWRRLYDPASATTHLGGSSSDPSRMAQAARSVQFWRGRYLVQRICYGRLAEFIVRAADTLLFGARALWHRFRSGKASDKYQYNHAAYETITSRLDL